MVAFENDVDRANISPPRPGGNLRAAVLFAVVLILASIVFASWQEGTAAAASARSVDSESVWIEGVELAVTHSWKQGSEFEWAGERFIPASQLWDGELGPREPVPAPGPGSEDISSNESSDADLAGGEGESGESAFPMNLRTY